MARDGQPGSRLDNYDLTRKEFAVRSLATLTRLIEEEARKPTPDLARVADLGAAVAALLASVG